MKLIYFNDTYILELVHSLPLIHCLSCFFLFCLYSYMDIWEEYSMAQNKKKAVFVHGLRPLPLKTVSKGKRRPVQLLPLTGTISLLGI